MSLEYPTTFRELIIQSGENFGSAEFILDSDRPALSYSKFQDQHEYVESTLRAAGLGPGARVGVRIPNGPDFASCLLCVMGSATCVPIHSAVPKLELERAVTPLRLDAVILATEDAKTETNFWTSHDVTVIRLYSGSEDPAGQFLLKADETPTNASSGSVAPSDIAIIHLTSGTTASPKFVPQTQTAAAFVAVQSSRFFNHSKDDCALSIMPLNHGQGLFVGLLPVLASGGSVVCGKRLEPAHFLALYETFKPTWFTAVPSFYQALLKYVSNREFVVDSDRLRYVRTGSAHMNAKLIKEVETFFGVPLLMGYGSAEGSNITNNPIPPGINKPGTVGVSYGQEIAIMDTAGNILGPNDLGEVILRGIGVTPGYLDNPEANAELFANGWLRTGDLGKLDEDGYLTLMGRIKEQINRGGESISPMEIEEAIRSHPAVVTAAVFAIEHPTLGEDVAAAIVAIEKELDERTLMHYLSNSLSTSKIPHEFLFVAELPVTRIGKIDKKTLGDMLAIQKKQRKLRQSVNPRSDLEHTVEQIWVEVLKLPYVGVTDHFLDLGGDSLSAMMIISRISERIGAQLELSVLFSCPTIAEQAQQIQHLLGEQTHHSQQQG